MWKKKQNQPEWNRLPITEVAQVLQTDLSQGLSFDEASERLKRNGSNHLNQKTGHSVLRLIFAQLFSPLVLILFAASAFSYWNHQLLNTGAFAAAAGVNMLGGFIRQRRLERTLLNLQRRIVPQAIVIRNGITQEIEVTGLVPGDLLLIDPGMIVPADIRLIEAHHLRVNEAVITGESNLVEKKAEPSVEAQPSGDLTNQVWQGTQVVDGRGRGIVVATGKSTRFIKALKRHRDKEWLKAPLTRRMTLLNGIFALLALLIGGAIYWESYQRGLFLKQISPSVITIVIAAIPQGLSAIAALILTIGVRRMARQNAILRKLSAVETLGSATAIAADTTGILTQEQLVVRRVFAGNQLYRVTGEGYKPSGEFYKESDIIQPLDSEELSQILKAALLCNNTWLYDAHRGWQVIGDPAEGALVTAAMKAGLDRKALETEALRLDELPFNEKRRTMATLHQISDRSNRIYLKGSPRQVLDLCDQMVDHQSIHLLTREDQSHIQQVQEDLSKMALQVIAVAVREVPADQKELHENELEKGHFIFLGFIGLLDSPRPEAAEVFWECQRAGILPLMATADHPAVAEVLARDIGLIKEKEQIITGNEMARMNQGKLEQLTEEASIFAQLEPEQKRRVIDALKARGRVTMAAESRTQDLAVLQQADLGIAMGRSGSDAVRQSSDLVLADDRLTTILDAVQEGRAIFEPVRRSLVYLLSTNLGEVLILLAVLALRLPLLLTPIMILWVNLIIDGFCKLPLAMEPVRRDVLSELPRRRKAPVITFKMISHILLLAIWIAAGTLGIYLVLRESVSIATARTMAFSTLVAFQWFNALNSRDERGSLLSIGLFSNLWLLAAILGTAAMQAAVIYVPALQKLMGTVALSGSQWGIVLLVSGSLWIISEIRKLIAPRLFSEAKAHDPEIYVHR